MQALLGRVLVWLLVRLKLAAIPASDTLFADNTATIVAAVRTALDAGGWRAAQAVIDAARKPGEALFALPEWVATTLLLGLPGSLTPPTPEIARRRLADLKRQYAEAGEPSFLFTHVHAELVRQLQAADTAGNRFSAGILQKMFEVRKDPTPPLGWRARELAVLTAFKQYPEYLKFLGVDKNGSVTLPRGTSYEAFASAMLANAYGPYPF
jgi:hypothetical protein